MTRNNLNTEQASKDMDLVERCLEGDDAAYGLLVDQYQNMVYNLAYRFLGESGEAEDLTQEVFLKVYKSLEGFRGNSTLKTWIYRITSNMALNRIKFLQRRHHRTKLNLENDGSEDRLAPIDYLSDDSPDPMKNVHATDISKRLQEALAAITPDQRAVVILRDIEGLSYEDIAQTLDINLGTVKSRLARGRNNIQGMMRDLL